MNELRIVDAGLVPYEVAGEWQRDLHRRRVANEIGDLVLLLEHPHVYSLGRSFRREHLLLPDDLLASRGIEVHEADRGGSITYHGPGQLVAYPIVDLRRPERAGHPSGRRQPDVILYVRTLEEAIIRTVQTFGVIAGRREGITGVWVGAAKLASIGVNVSRGVTKHGLALNVSTDLSFFEGMIPCGIPQVEVTSLEKILQRRVALSAVAPVLGRNLADVLHRRPVPGDLGSLGLGEEVPAQGEVIPFPTTGKRAG